MKRSLLIGALFIAFNSLAGNENDPFGARSGALGHASVSLSDFWSLYNNQAGLAFIENPFAGVSYENRYTVSELSRNFVGVIVPTKSGTFGFSLTSFGYSAYNEGKYGFAYARKLSEKMSLGVQLNYQTIRQGNDLGKQNNITAEIGFQAEIIEDLKFGVHIFNPNRSNISDNPKENIPTVFRLGAQYTLSEKVFIVAETEKDIDRSAIFKTGIEYHVLDQLYVRGGIATNPTYSSFGFGLVLDQIKIDLSTSYHQVLGHTPQFSLSYQFNKK